MDALSPQEQPEISAIPQDDAAAAEEPRRVFGRPFPKGVSGNPGGRPKGRTTTERIRRALQEAYKDTGVDLADVFIAELVKIALGKGKAKDRIEAMKYVIDRADGKPRTSIEIVGEGNEEWDALGAEWDALDADSQDDADQLAEE